MWTLETPWYELIARSAAIYFIVFTLFRLLGRKHLSKLATFDLILLILISETFDGIFAAEDKSVLAGAICVTTFMFCNVLVNYLTYRFPMIENWLEREPVLLVKDGKLISSALKEQRITEKELWEALRCKDIFDLKECKLAYFENNGQISVSKKKD
jgi:uncharacterized membrane protein YcaP (DUF421 family)